MCIVVKKNLHGIVRCYCDAVQFHGVNILVAVQFFHHLNSFLQRLLGVGFFLEMLCRGRHDAAHQGCENNNFLMVIMYLWIDDYQLDFPKGNL